MSIACFVTEVLLWVWYNLDGKPWYQYLLFWCADGAVIFYLYKEISLLVKHIDLVLICLIVQRGA